MRAFSLIEVLTVLAVVGVLAAIAVPNISEAGIRSRSDGSAREVPDALRRARNLALKNRCTVAISVNTTTATITATPSGCGPTASAATTTTFGPDVVLGAPSTAITFNERGGLSGATAIVSMTVQSMTMAKTIDIWPGFGKVGFR